MEHNRFKQGQGAEGPLQCTESPSVLLSVFHPLSFPQSVLHQPSLDALWLAGEGQHKHICGRKPKEVCKRSTKHSNVINKAHIPQLC